MIVQEHIEGIRDKSGWQGFPTLRLGRNPVGNPSNSPYARIYNLPVGYFGVVYYMYVFGLAALLAFDPFSRGLRFGALAYSALGVCFSIYFMCLQIAFIHAFCIYCLLSAVTTLFLFIAAISHFRATRAAI